MQKQFEAVFVHRIGFAERDGSSRQSCEPLPQDVVEALDVTRLSVALACGDMLLRRQHDFVRFPKISVEHAAFVISGDSLPQDLATRLRAVAGRISHNLARPAALGQPDPAFVLTLLYKGPEFIDFQAVAFLSGRKRIDQIRQVTDFF